MGGMGSDAAIEAADVVFMEDKPSKLADAIRIARKTRSIVRQNVAFALCIKLLVMLLGAVGIPVFAGFMGGPAVLLGKTGGYVIGYIFIALATALAVERSGKLPVIGAAMLAGLLVCYGFGTAWFMAVTGADLVSALGWCVLPFIVPDVCKGVLACVLGRLLAGRLAKAGVA